MTLFCRITFYSLVGITYLRDLILRDLKECNLPNYDLQDPTDLDIMRAKFDMNTADEWQDYIDLAEAKGMGYKNIKILNTAQRKAGIGKYLSPKVLNWILSLTEQLDCEEEE